MYGDEVCGHPHLNLQQDVLSPQLSTAFEERLPPEQSRRKGCFEVTIPWQGLQRQ